MSNPNSLLNQSNPENIVTAPKGSIFSREADNFFLFTNGNVNRLNVSKKAFALAYKNEIWYPTLKDDTISFATEGETWVKIGSGTNKTGWRQLSSAKSIFATEIIRGISGIIGAWAGYNSSYILNSNNELWATGENEDGQLGIGNTDYRGTASLVLTHVKLAASSCEGDFAGAVKNDNTLWFTGYGGNNSDYDVWTQTVLTSSISGSGAITDLVMGQYYSALLMEDDTLWVSADQPGGDDRGQRCEAGACQA